MCTYCGFFMVLLKNALTSLEKLWSWSQHYSCITEVDMSFAKGPHTTPIPPLEHWLVRPQYIFLLSDALSQMPQSPVKLTLPLNKVKITLLFCRVKFDVTFVHVTLYCSVSWRLPTVIPCLCCHINSWWTKVLGGLLF